MKEEFKDFPSTLSIRTIRGRTITSQVSKRKLFKVKIDICCSTSLTFFRSDKEEKCSERGTLVAEGVAILESLEMSINLLFGPEEE